MLSTVEYSKFGWIGRSSFGSPLWGYPWES